MQIGTISGINKPISRIIQGANNIGTHDLDASFELLDAAFELGINTFDTAHVYGNGDNERATGQWFNSRGIRDEIVLIAKGAHHNQDRARVTPFDIEADIHDSLARFQTDYFDIYLLHRDDLSVPVEPIIDILAHYQKKGVIGVYGASNWAPQRIEAANHYATENGLSPFVISSPNYSLADQIKPPWDNCTTISGDSHRGERDWYQANQMPLMTWSSLAGGFFSGRFTRDNLATFDQYADRLVVESYASEANFERLDRVKALAVETNRSVAQIAVAFVFNQPLNIFALLGARNREEIQQNIVAIEIELTAQDLAWLDLKTDTR